MMKRELKNNLFLYFLILQLVTALCLLSVTASAQCTEPPACIAAVNYGLSDNCEDVIPASSLLSNYNPACTYSVVIMRGGVPSPPNVSAADLGLTFPYMINNGIGGCTGTVTIQDYNPPVLVCAPSPGTLPCGYDFSTLAGPAFNDCTNPVTLTGPLATVVSNNNDCAGGILRVIRLTWFATDIQGNLSTCAYEVTITPADPEDLSAPANITLECTSDLDLSVEALGGPNIDGVPFDPTEVCNLMISDPVDQVGTICGNSRVITRRWTVMDMCDPLSSTTLVQVITINDTQAPQISLPYTTRTVDATSGSCQSGIVLLPAATISDACSATPGLIVFMQTPQGIINGNGGAISGLPLGPSLITYVVQDPCGNSATATLLITVQDNTPPNVRCRTYTTVPLSNLGEATVPAYVFNAGSSDNCGQLYFKVRRMTANACESNPQFNDQISFCCADIPDNNIMIILRVYDVDPGPGVVDPTAFAGRYNECMVEVEVQDKLAPTVTCPGDITIDCVDELSYYFTNEIPVVSDNCGANMTVEVTIDSSGINSCNLGTAIRTLTYTDQVNELVCVQNITKANITYTGGVSITWPEDYMMNACGGSYAPGDLPEANGYPVVDRSPCSIIGIRYEDDVFEIVEGACLKVMRNWEIINWCAYEQDTSTGIFRHRQFIKILDDEAPVIQGLADRSFTIDILDENCDQVSQSLTLQDITATDCTPFGTLSFRYRIDFDYLTDPGYDISWRPGNNASGVFPVGTHLVQFQVDDRCGNLATGTMIVSLSIADGKNPTPVMHDLYTALMPGAMMVSIPVHTFNAASYDNCTANADLRFSYSTDINDTVRIFTCEDVGTNPIVIYVWDEAGNFDFTTTNITITDNAGECPDDIINGTTVAGLILDEKDELVEYVKVELINSNKQPVVTGADGRFQFTKVPKTRSYQLVAAKDTDPLNGVTTIDILLIQRHILGIQALNSPYKLLAADANFSGNVTAADLADIQRLLLGKTTGLSGGKAWRFVDAGHVFNDPADPFEADIPDKITVTANAAEIKKNFVGIKMGDVNHSASMNSLQQAGSRNSGKTLYLAIEDRWVEQGEYLYFAVTAREFEQVMGFQGTFAFDPSRLRLMDFAGGMLRGFSPDNYNLGQVETGKVAFNWYQAGGQSLSDGEALFYIRAVALRSGRLGDMLELNADRIANEAYRGDLDATGRLQLLFDAPLGGDPAVGNRLLQNRPNPFSDRTDIFFQLESAMEATLIVTDIAGRVLWHHTAAYDKGTNRVSVEQSMLGQPGVYLYKLEAQGYSETKRMVLVNK